MTQHDCGKTFNGENMNARIASIFVLLVVSAAGSFSPILAIKYQTLGVPSWVIYVARFFGSGVILATAFIHLLGESNDSFASPCLSEAYKEYLWGSALALLGVFTMFTIEVITQRMMDMKMKREARREEEIQADEEMQINTGPSLPNKFPRSSRELTRSSSWLHNSATKEAAGANTPIEQARDEITYVHTFTPTADFAPPETQKTELKDITSTNALSVSTDDKSEELTKEEEQNAFQKIFNIFLLEFGIIFHSVFVGLSLAVAGEQFITLFIAISFHQFFEGMGLGARFATAKWPKNMQNFPWYLSLAYSLTTPIGIAAGLGVRHLYLNNDNSSLIVVGIFDGFCSGLLIYSCLIEFMGRDFLMDDEMRERKLGWLILAYAMFFLGTLFMALVGKWA